LAVKVFSHEREQNARFDAVALSADGRYVAAVDQSESSTLAVALVWEVPTQKVVLHGYLTIFPSPHAIAFHPQHPWLYLATSKGVLGFKLKSLKEARLNVPDVPDAAANIAISPNGRHILGFRYRFLSGRSFKIVAFDISKPAQPKHEWERPVVDPPRENWVSSVAFFPDGRRFVAAELPIGKRRKDGPRITVRNSLTGEGINSIEGPGTKTDQLAMSPLGGTLVTRIGKSLFVFDLNNLTADTQRLRNDGGQHFTGIAFHPSGRHLAATCNDGTVTFYDAVTWKRVRAFNWGVGRMRSIAFSPDGMLAAAGSDTGRVVVWDVDL
jgi:WD40 repeat protein